MRYATEKERERCANDARSQTRRKKTAPKCPTCGRRMYMDNFNGMFICYMPSHGGYQTTDQVENLLYDEMIAEIEGAAS